MYVIASALLCDKYIDLYLYKKVFFYLFMFWNVVV